MTTTGADPDADGYTFSLDGAAAEAIGVNENRTLTQVSTGDHTITLAGVADNCTVAGSNPLTVTVSAGATAQAAFAVSCDAPPLALSGTIAFETNRTGNFEIFSMKADGTNPLNLSNNAAFDFEPDWSPDGTKIAFVSDRDGNDEIYVMNADGSGQTRLTNEAGVDSYPEWSPDGGFIAFRSDRDGNIEIFAMAADGSGPQNLTNNAATDCHPTWNSTAAGGVVTASRVGAVGGPALAQRPRGITPSVGVPVTACLGR